MIHRPYVATMRSGDGSLFKVAWVDAGERPFLPFPSAFVSSRYVPEGEYFPLEVGEQWSYEFEPSPIDTIPEWVCSKCYVGHADWFLGDWPVDAPPVVIGAEGFAIECDGRCFMCVERVNAAADLYAVTGGGDGPIVTLSFDLLTVPAGYALQGPVSGPDAKPTFRALPAPPTPVDVVGSTYIDSAESPAGTFTISLIGVPLGLATGFLDPALIDSGALPSGVTLPADQLSAGTIGSGIDLPADQLSAGTIGSGIDLPADQLSAGTIGSGIDLPADQLSAGTLDASVDVPWGNISGAPTIPAAPTAQTLAATGTTQGTAAAITGTNVIVNFMDASNTGIILPATAAAVIYVSNRSGFGGSTLKVYPPSGESIVGQPTNNSSSVGPSVDCVFMRFTNTLGYYYWGRIG